MICFYCKEAMEFVAELLTGDGSRKSLYQCHHCKHI